MQGRTHQKLLVVFLLVTLSVFTVAQEKEKLTVEAVLQLEMVRSIDVSPDGEYVLFTKRLPAPLDGSAKYGKTHLFVYNVADEKVAGLITGDESASGVAWVPDGSGISYRKDGQLHMMTPDGIWHRQLTDLDVSVGSYKWSPNAAKIAWISQEPWSEEEKKAREMGKDWEVVEENYRHRQIHVVDVASGEHKIVTPDDYSVWAFDWSPSGEFMVITASEENTTDASYMLKKLYLLELETGKRELLVETEGKLTAPYWSPDGKYIAWGGGVDMTDGYQGSLFVYSMETKLLRNLTGDYLGTVKALAWGVDNALHVRYAEFQEENLYDVDPVSGEMTRVAGGYLVVGDFDSAGSTVAITASTPYIPSEMYISIEGSEFKRVTISNPDLDKYAMGNQVVYEWTASDGLALQGILIYPVGYEEGKRYPLVVQPHGGPESNYSNGWNTYYSRWSQLLANEGYFVFAPNYRASTGRGVVFVKADHHDLGGKEFQDVIDGVKALVADGLVDEDRVGSGGGSYGGYFSALAATKGSEHFAAAVVFAGITNWISFQGTSDIPIENGYVHWNEPEWYLKPDLMLQGSPVNYLDRANTPTLVAHGEKDLRVPLGQGQELFRSLKLKGVPTQLVIYPRAGHGLGEVQHQLDYAKRAIGWFNKYVRDKETTN